MNKQTLPIYIAIVLLLGVGIFFALRMSKNSNETTTETPKQNGGQVVDQKPTEPPPANSNTQPEQQPNPPVAENPKPTQSGQCQRDFDPAKLKNDVVVTAGAKVKLSVKNFGDITVSFYDKDAPKTVENFVRLTNSGYYNCLTFHRIAKGFVIQGGDPNGNGTGGDSAFGGAFADELNPKAPSYITGYKKGVLAMANAGPNTNTSQFFILLADSDWLPKNYTIFGKVEIGQNVVDKIAALEITPTNPLQPTDGSPKVPVVIEKATLVK